MAKPHVNSEGNKELDKVEKQFDEFKEQIDTLTMDRLNAAPKEDVEPQTKIATKDMDKNKETYLKPFKTCSCTEKFNEKFRKDYEDDKEYVRVIAENKELIGETIDIWSKPYAGVPAAWWKVPVNKPVWMPKYVAAQIKRKGYHRFVQEEKQIVGHDGMGTYTGTMIVDTTIQRLDCYRAEEKKQFALGSRGF